MAESEQEALREGLKKVAVSLKELGRPFALSGGYAAWVRGAPEPDHDVDFLISPEDASDIAVELRRAGLDVRQPPEDWLFKVGVNGAMVDVIHRSTGSSVGDILGRAEAMPVLSVLMPVVSATDLATEKLLVMDEHYCDFGALLPVLRAIREGVDWEEVRRRTKGQPFAEAFLFLLEQLEVIARSGD